MLDAFDFLTDIALVFEVQDDLIRSLVGARIRRVDHDIWIDWFLVRVRDTSELLDDARPRFGV